MADFTLPALTSTYTDVINLFNSKIAENAKMFDGTTYTNLPTGTIKWNSSNNRFEKWDGTAWGALAATYQIDVATLGTHSASYFAKLNGDATQTFKVADAVNADEAVSKGQLLTEMKAVDGAGSGLDADLLRGLPADFTANLSGNGYQKLPNGLIIQWGMMVSGSDGMSISFPITFPNAIFTFVATSKNSSHNYPVQILGLSTSAYSIDSQVGGSPKQDTYWIAIGH